MLGISRLLHYFGSEQGDEESVNESELTPAQAYRLQTIRGSASLTTPPTEERATPPWKPDAPVQHMTLSEFCEFSSGLDWRITRITSNGGPNMVLIVHFDQDGAEYFLRISRPVDWLGRLMHRIRRQPPASAPVTLVADRSLLPQDLGATPELLLYIWRRHHPSIDPSYYDQLMSLADIDEGGRLCRLLNSVGSGASYDMKPHLTIMHLSEILDISQSLVPWPLPASFKDRFFAWNTIFMLAEHFGHDLFMTFRKSIHPDYLLSFRDNLEHYGAASSVGSSLAILLLTLPFIIPLLVMDGFLFRARDWPIGGIFYLLLALPAGLSSHLPAVVKRLWKKRINQLSITYRATLVDTIRTDYGGSYGEAPVQWSFGPRDMDLRNSNPEYSNMPPPSGVDKAILPEIGSLVSNPMSLYAFMKALKARPRLGTTSIRAVQCRQVNGSPFKRAYLLFFIRVDNEDWAVRIDPPSKYLVWYRPFKLMVGDSLVRVCSVEASNAATIIEHDSGNGSDILFTLNSWNTAFPELNPKDPFELISLAAQSRVAHRRLTSLTNTPSLLRPNCTPTLLDVSKAVHMGFTQMKPGYSSPIFTLKLACSVILSMAKCYPAEYLPSVGDEKTPVHPWSFMKPHHILQGHRLLITHLNILVTVLFYALLFGLAFVTPHDYNQFMLWNTTVIFSYVVVWYVLKTNFLLFWLGDVERSIENVADYIARYVLPSPSPRKEGSVLRSWPPGSNAERSVNWDSPPGSPDGLSPASDRAQRLPSWRQA